MKTGGAENLPVSVKHILGFSRMRKYKPPTAVIESLKKSTFLDVVDGKYLRRKVPLNLTLLVEPQSQESARKEKKVQQEKKLSHVVQQAQDKPWLTKGMVSCLMMFHLDTCADNGNSSKQLDSKSSTQILLSLQ